MREPDSTMVRDWVAVGGSRDELGERDVCSRVALLLECEMPEMPDSLICISNSGQGKKKAQLAHDCTRPGDLTGLTRWTKLAEPNSWCWR